MKKVVHTSRVTITRERGPTRKALIEGFDQPVYYGVHGGIKHFYKVDPQEEHAATLDHIVGAVGGWMMGTLAAVLAEKGIRTHKEVYRAEVKGEIEDVNGVLKITTIGVTYHLNVADDKKAAAQEAFANYLERCPGAQSVIGCIAIEHDLQFGQA